MHYVVVGLSHKSAPLELREKLAIPESRLAGFLTELVSAEDIQEAMLVSTCNRVEAYLVTRHEDRAVLQGNHFFSRIGSLPLGQIEPHLYVKTGPQAIAHLFRVVASLDSMVVGEPQVRGQVKQAYTQAVASQTTGTYLNRLVHRALAIGKRIRRETGIGQYPVSVSSAAVALAGRIFENLREKQVLVIGAGEMSELVCRHLKERKVDKIVIANRSLDKATTLAREFGQAAGLENLESLLRQADIVISSIASDHALISKAMMEQAMSDRKGRSMFLIDLGVPRNIDPEGHHIENVYLYSIDDLQGIVTLNKREREREAEKAEEMIREAVGEFQQELRQADLAPTIRELSKKFDRIRQLELEKYLAKHRDLTEKEREDLEACTQAIVNKILHHPIIFMKTEPARDGQPRISEILQKLFKLEAG